MLAKRTFGKLGKRVTGRLDLGIEGGMATTGHSHACRVENVSRAGCCLHMDVLPRLGTTVMVKIERVETIGNVAWVRGGRCGIRFEDPLNPKELERLRWIVNHAEKHEQNTIKSATAMWR